MRWDDLPSDMTIKILTMRAGMIHTHRLYWGASCIQKHWRGYRTRTLIIRFRALRHLWDFRAYNPCVQVFLSRTRLYCDDAMEASAS